MEMCGENQKTLKFYIKKGKERRKVLHPDTPVEVPQAPLRCLRNAGGSWQGGLEADRYQVPGEAWPCH